MQHSLKVMLSVCFLLGIGAVISPAQSDPLFFSGEEGIKAIHARFPGSGSAEDPYRIENLIVDATGSDYGILLENLSEWIAIDRVEVFGAMGLHAQGGIILRSCEHVVVRDCDLHDNRVGIKLEHCSGLRIEGNRVVRNLFGIVADFLSHRNTIVANRFDNAFNAKAASPNVWFEGGIGNCWADAGEGAYRISPGNTDLHPLSLALCPAPTDRTPPIIRDWGAWPLPIEVGTPLVESVLAVADAIDDRDGAVELEVESTDVNTSELRKVSIVLRACDRSGNCAEVRRMVEVVDTTPPSLRLLPPPTLVLNLGAQVDLLDPGVEAFDLVDGDLSNRVHVDYAGVNSDTMGVYEIRYLVSDSSGNTSAELRRMVLVGFPVWPDLLSDVLPFEASLNKWSVDGGLVRVDIFVKGAESLSEWLVQLYLADILRSVLSRFPPGLDMPFGFTISDTAGTLLSGVICEERLQTALSVGSVELLRLIDYERERMQLGRLLVDSVVDSTEARERVIALAEYFLDRRDAAIVQVIPVLIDGEMTLSVSLLYGDELDGDSTSAVREHIVSKAENLARSIHTVLPRSHVAIAVFADYYGLIYRGELVSGKGATAVSWVSRYVHPVLEE